MNDVVFKRKVEFFAGARRMESVPIGSVPEIALAGLFVALIVVDVSLHRRRSK